MTRNQAGGPRASLNGLVLSAVDTAVVALTNTTLSTTYGRAVSERRHVFVRVTAEAGADAAAPGAGGGGAGAGGGDARLEGFGEASPLPHFTGEDAVTIDHVIRDILAPALLGRPLPAFLIEEAHVRMDRAIPGNSTAKSALVMALFDLVGKACGLPVHALLGGAARRAVPLAGAVGIEDVDATVEAAVSAVEDGAATVKMKVGLDLDRDVRAVTAVRKAVGPAVAIRLDANQGMSRKDALRLAEAVAPLRIQYLEQPLPAHDLSGLAWLRSRSGVAIAVDESVYGPREALQVIRAEAADVIVIKLIKAGGLWRGFQVATIARAAGLPCVLVSPYESTLGSAATIHAAAAFPNAPWACEAGISEIPNDPTRAIGLGAAGQDAGQGWGEGQDQGRGRGRRSRAAVIVGDAPGLGVEVDPGLFAS